MPRGIKTQKTIKEGKEIKVFYNEEIPDQPLPEITNLEELKYQGGKLKDLNLDEGRKLENIEEGAMNLANHTSDELPEGVVHLYDDIDASNRAKAGLTAEGFVQKVIRGANITGTPAVGVNVTNQYIGYYNGSTWPVYIANNGLFMFQGNSGNYITWDGSVLNIRGRLNADDITAGTLTGRTIQTASGNQRIEMDATNHWIRFYDLNEHEQGRLKVEPNYFIIGTGQDNTISFMIDLDAGVVGIPLELNKNGVFSAAIKPAGGTYSFYNLGAPNYKWYNLYLSGNIYIDGTVDGVDISAHAVNASAHHTKTLYSSELIVNSDWIPNIDNYWDLGSSAYRWYRLFISRGIEGGYHHTGLIDIGKTNGFDILPYGDNYGSLGYRSGYGGQAVNRRWSQIHGVTIVSGDFVLDNKFRITEEGEKGLAFFNPKNEKIAILDEEGNLFIKGRIKTL